MDRFVGFLKQRVPSRYVDVPGDICGLENQGLLLEEIQEDLELNPNYFKPIFQKILSRLEAEESEVLDDIYEVYLGKLLSSQELSVLDTDVLSYRVSPAMLVKIKENQRLISGFNTTGLRTWEASIYLSYYLVNEYDFSGQTRVLELGTGTGLVGLSLIKHFPALEVVMTDGDSQLVQNLATNFDLNDISLDRRQCYQYIWGAEDPVPVPVDGSGQYDLCVGADITYDTTILDPLIASITKLFTHHGLKKMIIACTIRNELTIEEFRAKLDALPGFEYTILPVVEVPTMFIPEATRFNIIEIRRSCK